MDPNNLVCQNCEVEIKDPMDGRIVQGNIHVAQINKDGQPCGGLIGQSFPEKDLLFTLSDVDCYCYCNSCFLKFIGLDPFMEYFS